MSPQNHPPVPLLDLKAQFATIKDQVLAAVTRVFEEQSFILGPHVATAEKDLAAFLGVPQALGVSSGTDALLLSLMALGIGPGDGVVTTPFTFFATVGSIVRLGAVPLLADIDPATYNLDPAKVAELLSRSDLPAPPKALVPVHLFGQPADMIPLMELARQYKLKVVEDAAQAIGVVYPGPAGPATIGSIGHTGAFSFFPSKNLGGAGDGGLITCQDPELAARLRSMRTHGSHPNEKYRHIHVGGNFRLDAVQAAVISVKLQYLEAWSDARRANALDYDRMFKDSGLLDKGLVATPHRAWPDQPRTHVFNQYVIRVKDREALMSHLGQAKIGHAVYYPIPMHLLECFARLGGAPGDLPVAEQAAQEVLAIPVYPELTSQQKQRVVEVIADFYAGR
ncbi:MAG: DegT/DnrJ/EryC1/StrS family aminotransferase [Pseudomonadota bacterium]